MLKGFGAMDAIANVTDSLVGMDFPRSKDDIIEYAKDHNTPDRVIVILEKIPDQTYSSMGDLINKLRGL
jgi:hypothetical protein